MHGNIEDGILSKRGMAEMDALAKAIAANKSGGSYCLLSSPAFKVRESAQIIMKRLGMQGFEVDLYLWSEATRPLNPSTYFSERDIAKLVDVVEVRKERADNFIVVTHHPAAEDLAQAYIKRIGSLDKLKELKFGQGVWIDLANRAYRVLP